MLYLIDISVSHLGHGASDGEEDGEGDEAIVEAEHADEEEDLEEGEADVGLGGREEDEGKQGGEAAVEDGRANLAQGGGHALVPGPASGKSIMA